MASGEWPGGYLGESAEWMSGQTQRVAAEYKSANDTTSSLPHSTTRPLSHTQDTSQDGPAGILHRRYDYLPPAYGQLRPHQRRHWRCLPGTSTPLLSAFWCIGEEEDVKRCLVVLTFCASHWTDQSAPLLRLGGPAFEVGSHARVLIGSLHTAAVRVRAIFCETSLVPAQGCANPTTSCCAQPADGGARCRVASCGFQHQRAFQAPAAQQRPCRPQPWQYVALYRARLAHCRSFFFEVVLTTKPDVLFNRRPDRGVDVQGGHPQPARREHPLGPEHGAGSGLPGLRPARGPPNRCG